MNTDALETTCVDWKEETPCRSGMPFLGAVLFLFFAFPLQKKYLKNLPRFYRMRMNGMSAEACFQFCIGKGLDLFGVVKGEECRCGASRLNTAVWGESAPRPGLELPAKLSSCDTDQACPLRAYRFVGPFVGGGSVPEHFMMPTPSMRLEVCWNSIIHCACQFSKLWIIRSRSFRFSVYC